MKQNLVPILNDQYVGPIELDITLIMKEDYIVYIKT